MLKLNCLGKDASLSVLNGSLRLATRIVAVYGPAFPELSEQRGGGQVRDWERKLAGLPNGIDPDVLPIDPAGDYFDSFRPISVDLKAFAEGIKALSPIVSSLSVRNFATVLCFDEGTLVATDGFRLLYTDLETSGLFKGTKVSIPAAALKLLSKVLPKASALEISGDETVLRVTVGDYKVFVRTSAVKFPNWRGLIPTIGQNAFGPRSSAKPIDMEDVLKAIEDCAPKVKASKRSEEIFCQVAGQSFNARFVKDLPSEGSAYIADDMLWIKGPVSAVLVAVKMPEAKQA